MVKRYPSLSPMASAPGIRSAACGPGPPLVGGPNSASVVANLWNCDMYWTCMVLMVCNSRITAISFAFMRALPSLGTAIARIIKMMAITIKSSISEKPRARRRFGNCTISTIMTRNVVVACRRLCLRQTQLEFRATGVCRFGGPILANEPVLVGIEGPAAGSAEHLWIRMDRIAAGCRGQDEHVSVFIP